VSENDFVNIAPRAVGPGNELIQATWQVVRLPDSQITEER
jgi:hypothetical protein